MASAPASRPDPAQLGGGREAWSGSAHNRWMPLLLVLVLGHAAVVNLFLGRPAATYLNAAHLILLAVLELFSKVSVSIDGRALAIRYGHLGWLRQRIALERIAGAHSCRLEPMEHGGWGYRGSLRWSGRAALVVRGGPALELALAQDERLTITLDDAERAAEAINTLIARRSPTARPNAEAPAPGGSSRP